MKARGVEPLFRTGYVQQRPRMVYQSHFRSEYVFMEKDGRTWMLLVSLLLGDCRAQQGRELDIMGAKRSNRSSHVTTTGVTPPKMA
jgi:hypothetical protein